jgi:hypothetical protein
VGAATARSKTGRVSRGYRVQMAVRSTPRSRGRSGLTMNGSSGVHNGGIFSKGVDGVGKKKKTKKKKKKIRRPRSRRDYCSLCLLTVALALELICQGKTFLSGACTVESDLVAVGLAAGL